MHYSLLEEIFEFSPDAIFVFDKKTLSLKFANETALKETGYPSRGAENYYIGEFFPYAAELCPHLLPHLKKKKHIKLCTYQKRKNGKIYPVESSFCYTSLNDDSFLVIYSRPIINYVHKKKDIQQSYYEGTLDNDPVWYHTVFTETLHDIRTSLDTMGLSIASLEKRYGDQIAETAIQNIKNLNGDLQKQIHQSLKIFKQGSYKESVDCHTINLDALCSTLKTAYDPVAKEKKIRFNVELNTNLTTICSDPTFLKRILNNLLSNAFKYSKEGEVELTIYDTEGITDDSSFVCFKVRDTGIGISDKNLQKIFQRFQQLDTPSCSQTTGLGLGLSIAQKLAHQLHGYIEVESEKNIGSSFTLCLPRNNKLGSNQLENNSEVSPSKKINDNEQGRIDKTILLLDDNQAHNEALKEFLEFSIHKCLTATSSKEALATIKNDEIDGIILDLTLSNTDGLEFAKNLQQGNHLSPKMIVYSGKQFSDRFRNKLLEHVDAVVTKGPGSYNELLKKLTSILTD